MRNGKNSLDSLQTAPVDVACALRHVDVITPLDNVARNHRTLEEGNVVDRVRVFL